MLPAVALTVELLHFQPQSQRAAKIFDGLSAAAAESGIKIDPTAAYHGAADALMLWGPGAPDRVAPMQRQLATGRHVLALDLAYWDRDRKFRVSIDAPHPQAWVMRRALPATRLLADGVKLESLWNPTGPVVIAGIGDKAGTQYGADAVRRWERELIAQAQASGRKVLYRPKKSGGPVPDIPHARAGTIDQALAGTSTVITWHSNVAVDAIRLGIPAICRDGAAAAVCGSEWRDDLAPLPEETRAQFLANLAWFQYSVAEAKAFWRFVRETVA